MPDHWKSSLNNVYRQSAYAAMREHVSLGTDMSKRIDIFGIIQRHGGIWLMFQPLGVLYGAYQREGKAAGIQINSKHPPNLQRYTGAHEYGHHILGHGSSLDREEHIQATRRQINPQELAAQTFAAHFLMPLQLINTLLQQMELTARIEHITPRELYLLSLELGTSYIATVNHLYNLKKLSLQRAVELREKNPKEIKGSMRYGRQAYDSWADVWPLERFDAGRLIHPSVNDELHISLPELPSQSAVWSIRDTGIGVVDARESGMRDETEGYVALAGDELQISAGEGLGVQPGTACVRHMTFRVLKPGHYTLQLEKQEQSQTDALPMEVFEIQLDISPRQVHGLSEKQKPLLG